jgi:hypothetical protein
MHPHLAEINLCRQLEQIADDAERHRLTHPDRFRQKRSLIRSIGRLAAGLYGGKGHRACPAQAGR